MRTVITIIMLVLTLVDLTPFIFNFKLVQHPESARLTEVLASQVTLMCLVYMAATTVPMLFDVLLYIVHRDAFFISARAVLLIALIFPLVMIGMRHSTMRTDVFVVMNSIQSLWIAGALASGMTRSDAVSLKSYKCYVFYTLFGLSRVLSPFSERGGKLGLVLAVFSNIFFVAACVWVTWMCVTYLKEVWRRDNWQDIKANEYLPFICITQMCIYMISWGTVAIAFRVLYFQDANQFVCSFRVIIASFVAVITTLVPGRVARSQVPLFLTCTDRMLTRVNCRYVGARGRDIAGCQEVVCTVYRARDTHALKHRLNWS
jgi:hypothetical protein